jgi:dipeptidyl aminopeptidase/acylaminoacyl peptidase
VVSFAGPVNLVGQFPEVSQGILDNFLGGGQEELADVYRRASPVSYVTAGDAPMLLFQGTADVLVPYDQGFQMATALAEAGVPGRVELLVGENHGWGEPEAGRTLRATSEFLNRHLRP